MGWGIANNQTNIIAMNLVSPQKHFPRGILEYFEKVLRAFFFYFTVLGARCSFAVRALAHGAMDRRIDPSCLTH